MRHAALAVLALCLASTAAQAKVTRYLTGNAGDVEPILYGPALVLGGGGTDVDAALQWIIDEVRGCAGPGCADKIDIVILRASGADGYNDYLYAMNGVDSVESIVVTSRRSVDQALVDTVTKAELVFFAGGDQCDYVEIFKGTPVETAVESVHARGGGVGGTSAGLAIQGQFVFDACNNTVTSDTILANPYNRRASFTSDFFAWPHLQGVMTDSHFVTRDRMGRLMGFLARQIQDGVASSALGLGINEATSVVVDSSGLATVIGDGPAYFVLADHAPEACAPKQALGYSDYRIWKVGPGETFDLANRPTTGYHEVDVTDGVLSMDPY
jgi:cyanophycinase